MNMEFREKYIEARKKVVENDFAKLNPMQRKAVMATQGALLILAGAGSGKTTVLINRIANLLRYGKAGDSDEIPADASEGDIDVFLRGGDEARELAALEPVEPWRILAITFTNKAAEELKTRLSDMLGEAGADVWASTFHSACVKMLRRDADRVGFKPSFTIYDTADSKSLIKHIISDFNLDEKEFDPRVIRNEISRAKDDFCSPEEMYARAKTSGDRRKVRIAEIYDEYSRRSAAAGAMDFDDLIYYTVKLLNENEDVCQYWQRRFKYILIDEYQDTNKLQYMLASKLAEGWGNICVVGDDDQSIYKFRGATIENILSFEDEYKGCRVIRLEQNYRSTGHILGAANAVIKNNLGRKGKELWTNSGDGELPELYVADNEFDEASFVASQILGLYGKGSAWRESAVLYRMNAQSRQIEQAFKRNGIPYKIFGGTGFFDRAEVKDMLAYLCVIASPSDDLRLGRIINNPPRGIGAKTIETAANIAAENGISMFEVISKADLYPELGRSVPRLLLFAGMMNELIAQKDELAPDLLYDQLVEKSGYLSALERKNTTEDTVRAENVKELKTSIINYKNETSEPTLEGYLADVALYTDMDNYEKDDDCVVMMTMHAAKGLEFPNVFIVGCEETVFPGVKAIGEQEEMEEERRLCYVALTRAKKKLFLSCARQRMIFGRTTSNRVSRFVDEIPPEHLEKRGIPRGYGYSEKSSVQKEAARRTPSYNARRPVAPPPSAKPKATAEAPKFSVGDRVLHKAFGEGQLVKMTPMGNDYFIEIEFDSGVRKKLMLRAAVQYMVKI
mgnify:FL=1